MKNIKIQTPDANLVSVCRDNNPLQADLVRGRLEESGVDAKVDGEFQAGFAGVLPVNVLVHETDVSAAIAIIQKIFPAREQ